MPNGEIQKEHKERLKAVGNWLAENGKTIYGTRGGIISATKDYVSTQKDKILYLHILNSELNQVQIDNFEGKIKRVTFFNDRSKHNYKLKKGQLIIEIPDNRKHEIDTILEIILK